ncbi:EamA family transporter [Roseisolibacter sp. H3M3-2]|uniref:DMT family transporter n=1 Tax=Roseisolibacter sp. H3M3-2 TaxID=3031323 RepID=UPI0023DC2501|nr:EamA family transporter [Roseisolibacter sp. H3M3-2]MDF1505023.1 EamA family transporter [Roseisolibacter sp. H3M3-2]
MRTATWLTDLMMLAMALLWGVNFSVVKYGTRVLPPLAFNALRVALATAVLGGLALALWRERPARADMVRLATLGLLGHGVYQFCFIQGIARSSVATSALVLASSPALIGLVGRGLGTERPTRRAWAGIGLQLLGMAGVVLGSAVQPSASAESPLLGALILLAGSVSWAFYAVLLKPLTQRVHPIHLSAFTLLGGVGVLVGMGAPALAALDARAVPAAGWGAVAYAGLAAMVLAYLFYYRGVRVLGPVRTAMYSNLQPLIAMAVAYLTLHEVPTPWQIGGAAAITTGLLVSRK